MKIRLYRYLPKTSVDGPGIRTAIWVQGCSKHCRSCMMEGTWDYSGGYEEETDNIINRIKNTPGIEGVTFLGGEPFDQAEAVYKICASIKSFGLSVIIFTGYLKEEIDARKDEYSHRLRDIADILIDGPFIESKKDFTRPWVGSSNQRYFFMTDRYRSINLKNYKNKIEVRLRQDGTVLMNGMGDFDSVVKLIE